jgi:SAM domain (Sterile alpha motif)
LAAKLGLAQYEAAFRENAVDSAILPELTADDLKEIGVVAVGHRRRLLAATAALGLSSDSSVSPAPSTAPAPTASPPLALAPASSAASASIASVERRPITVMFCDLGPALAGFSPTPEFPQIAEAKALFEALAAAYRRKIIVEE